MRGRTFSVEGVAARHLKFSSVDSSGLQQLLGLLRAMHWSHWTGHWQAGGISSYSDHILLERLYTDIVEEIDALAEKLVGMFGAEVVEPGAQMANAAEWLARWAVEPKGIARALLAERDLQVAFKRVYGDLKAAGSLPLGLDDYLMATCNTHETHLYLLQQRLGGRQAGLRAHPVPDLSAEGHFFDRPRSREVREFAESGALSNVDEISALSNGSANGTAQSRREEHAALKESPPTPAEILEDVPGSGEFSTLSRYLVMTKTPTDAGVPKSRDDIPKHPDFIKTSGWTFARRWE